MNFPKDFPICPVCNSTELVMRDGAEGCPDLLPGERVGLQKVLIGLYGSKVPAFQMEAILVEWDVCGGCGLQRVVHVDKVKMPVPSMKMPKMPPGSPQGPFPFPR